MRWKHDDWAQQWNAERLVVGVEDVLHCWEQDSGQATGKLDDLLRAATSHAVMFLEAAYRGRRHSLESRLGNDSGALIGDFGAHAPAVAALLTFDRSGYLREAGVRWLASCDEKFVLPFLLLRLNDPVDPVRERAIAAVDERLDVGHAALLVQLLPLIERLGARRRAAPIVRAIGDLLVSGDPAGRSALWAGSRSDDAAVRASCLRMLATIEPAAPSRSAAR